MLDFIKTAKSKNGKPRITWDEKGVVKFDKKEISGSHIIDLVNDIVRTRKTFAAVGRDGFAQILNEIGVPRENIGNSDLLKAYNKTLKANTTKDINNSSVKEDTTVLNFHSFTDGTTTASTPKSSKKKKNKTGNQSGFGWLTLNI